MRKKLCVWTFSLLWVVSLMVTTLADQFSEDVEKLTRELSDKMHATTSPIAVGLGSFFYGDSKMSSDFAVHFAAEVENAATNVPRFTLVNRSRLDEILRELDLQMSDLIDPDTVKRLGRIQGLDAMLTGQYSLWGKGVRVKAELIHIEDARMVAVTEVIGGIPDNVTVKPPQYEVQRQRIEEKVRDWISEEPAREGQAPKSDFRITIEPDRAVAYREGEELTLYVKSDVDCYIEVYDIAPDGATHLIFPNEYWEKRHSRHENFIRAGVRMPLPYDDSFRLEIFPPYGVETLKVVASTKPFGARTRAFYEQKGAFPRFGNIDEPETVKALKHRTRSVLAQPEGDPSEAPAKVAQTYCTILTKP